MKVEDLFPLEGEITQEIIDKADIWNPMKCIGALALKAALLTLLKEEDFTTSWAADIGHPTILGERRTITTKEDVDLMDIKKPQKVTFIIQEIYE
jgi:hypothetical protein